MNARAAATLVKSQTLSVFFFLCHVEWTLAVRRQRVVGASVLAVGREECNERQKADGCALCVCGGGVEGWNAASRVVH